MQTRFQARPSYLLSAVTVATALLISGCSPSQGGQQAGPGGAQAPVVEVLTVKTQDVVLTSELAGRTAPYLIAEVRPQVSGVIQARNFKEGGEVEAGQTLYQIEAARYESALDSAKASLAKAEANLTSTRLRAMRYEELADIEAVSKQARDDAQASLKQAQADVLSASAQVRSAQIDLNYTRVNAPISGRIGRSSVTPGALVTANQSNTLVTVQQLDPIYVDVTQSSTELMRLQKDLAEGRVKAQGQGNVKLLLEDGSTYAYAGKLQFSEVSVDPSTGTVTLRAVFPNPKRELLPGMYVRAVIEKGVSQQSIVVPQKAVSRDAKGNASVMTVTQDGKVLPKPIAIGQSLGDNWLVTSGLQGGDNVIVEGLQVARPGATVQATAWQDSSVQKTAQASR
ncbi:efflux RND transporter periplasmic adaptor subunit [Hylemonella sp. W303a]|uniref:efflux RND transporter periplasmic adaptor subunit n=1 Tax=Hylemonella sp. W303a TaxID=3389873 RepID=UPI00396B4741